MLAPTQIVVALAVIDAVGNGLTVIVVRLLLVKPLPSVMVSV